MASNSRPWTAAVAALLISACGPMDVPEDPDPSGQKPGSSIRLPPDDGNSYNCGDIPEGGICEAGAAIYCNVRENQRVEKRCESKGLTCEETRSGARCVDEYGDEPASETECGDVDANGECHGDELRYCLQGTLVSTDCSDSGTECGEDPLLSLGDDFVFYECIRSDPVVDDNGPAESCTADRCSADGAAVLLCSNGNEATFPCGDDALCSDETFFVSCEPMSCFELPAFGACNATQTGYSICHFDTLEVETINCDLGEICGYDALGSAECRP